MALESVFRDVATIVSEKCVNPASNRPYTVRTQVGACTYDNCEGVPARRFFLDLRRRFFLSQVFHPGPGVSV